MYSRIPMPKSEWTEENISYAICFFPLVGGVIGAITYGLFVLKGVAASQGVLFSDLFWTILLLLVPIAITGGIHMDGFLDTQDAVSSYQPREKRLEILKDSHAGAFAIISCAVYLLAYLGIYSSLTIRSVTVIAWSFLLSRSLSGLSVITFPQARKEGMAATFSQNAAKKASKRVLLIYVAIICSSMVLTGKILGIVAIVTAGLVFWYYYRMSMSKFGGITGDLAGYFLQMCELLMAASVVIVDVIVKGLAV